MPPGRLRQAAIRSASDADLRRRPAGKPGTPALTCCALHHERVWRSWASGKATIGEHRLVQIAKRGDDNPRPLP
jgi:hypothetical protein